ncbi:hypothetical protein ACIRD8_28350 [Streptomyces sp. NPDC102451]|uniref:hypothetical protein n=1 Tax=Streptomyces sp. NPDC102451 TaxID=3366177 RepID=UPI00382D3C67
MTRRPQPRRITLGGREAVALTLQEYERLLASRRQIGGQSARVRVLGRQVKQAEQLLQELETLAAVPDEGCGRGGEGRSPCMAPRTTAGTTADDASTGTGTDCLRCAIAALVRRHRDAEP